MITGSLGFAQELGPVAALAELEAAHRFDQRPAHGAGQLAPGAEVDGGVEFTHR
ncbi:hypothetical protein [Mycobacterium sp. 1164985.4]|uniref:hypothetical protein n=1 Tax=Mycobacterium sp. 1164985.4 TaxID=1834069 RepID=UPI0012EAA799|nr:hypothetical protein [Mycobacterium sp. 1164985.4]